MLQFAWLLLHLSSQEDGSWGNDISVEAVEAVHHVETMHVHYCGVYYQLATEKETMQHSLHSHI